ncbi:hypothetical protein [Motilibacter deserti]|uniref:CysZ protein n=1 Tax=Motilibacter deserti TaxID=2714956 RepID=A0ABX0GPM1_9ACTN|nr:hypothetical protein [Motilibacter deserti]NHC12667.1 hypothetical protein [Motilibacter deserti]
MIDPLLPQQIAGLYGRDGSVFATHILRSFQPKVLIIIYSTALLLGLIIWTAASGDLLGASEHPWAFALFGDNPGKPKSVRLPLFLDPVGIVLILTALSVPLLCAQQVVGINKFNEMNERNMQYRVSSLDLAKLNQLVRKTNRAFSFVGSRWVSLGILMMSCWNAVIFKNNIDKYGLLSSWNPSRLTDDDWRKVAYNGWWANDQSNRALSTAVVVIGTYLTYHVTKQLAMGIIFAVFAGRALKRGFGVAPNLELNTDGYHGLRDLRYFMQWTYVATTLDFFMMMGILVVWLPFNVLTVFMLLVVVATNVLTVLYPTSVAIGGALLEKKHFVRMLANSSTGDELEKQVTRVWAAPSIPFRLRSALSVITIYLLLPTLLALVSALLK